MEVRFKIAKGRKDNWYICIRLVKNFWMGKLSRCCPGWWLYSNWALKYLKISYSKNRHWLLNFSTLLGSPKISQNITMLIIIVICFTSTRRSPYFSSNSLEKKIQILRWSFVRHDPNVLVIICLILNKRPLLGIEPRSTVSRL